MARSATFTHAAGENTTTAADRLLDEGSAMGFWDASRKPSATHIVRAPGSEQRPSIYKETRTFTPNPTFSASGPELYHTLLSKEEADSLGDLRTLT
jgi:hypothetical protein